MHSQWLEAFVSIARHGIIRHAASDLHVSQSTLSRQLGSLEKYLGVQLVTRKARGVALTESGKRLYSQAVRVLENINHIDDIVAIQSGDGPLIRLGLPPSVPKEWVVLVLGELDDFSLFINEFTTNEQHDLLADDQLDIALTHDRSPGVASHVLLEQRLGLAVPEGSTIHKRVDASGAVPMEALGGTRIIAHSHVTLRSSEGTVRSLAAGAGADVSWVFRRFSQHADLITRFSQADGAITVSSAALASQPTWSWYPLSIQSQQAEDLILRTWINWNQGASDKVDECAQRIITKALNGAS